MKRIRATAGGLVLAFILGACGGPVDETLLPTPVPTYGPERFLVDAETMPSVAPETDEEEPVTEATPEPVADAPIDEEVEEAEGDEVEIEEVEVGEADVEEPAAEDETVAPTVDDAIEDAADDEAEAEASMLPTPTPEATPVDEDDAVSDEAAESEAVEDEADIDAAAAETDEVEAAEDTTVDEVEDIDTEADESEVDGADVDEAAVEEEAEPVTTPLPADEETADADVADEEIDEAEIIDEALDKDEAVEETDAAIHPDWEGLPDEILAAMTTADPARGEQLSVAQGCVACHALDPEQLMVGPTWHDMAGVARTRVEGESAGVYLYNSTIHPNDYIVEGYLPNIMLQIYEDVLNEQELADIIAYLLTLEADD